MELETWQIIAIAAGAAALLIVIAVAMMMRSSRNRKSQRLQQEFGTEYSTAVETNGNRKVAERELEVRKQRVESYKLRDLTDEEVLRFANRWKLVQAEFVSEPVAAVARADELLVSVMGARGYDVSTDERRAADLSIGHPVDAAAYREARAVAAQNARGNANTEDLRRAMLAYGQVMDDMLAARSNRN